MARKPRNEEEAEPLSIVSQWKNIGVYFDKSGKPIGTEEFLRLFDDMSYRRVAGTTLSDGTWVSTVWLGIDHGFNNEIPVIFETMAFPSQSNMDEIDQTRATSQEEALQQHWAMVQRICKDRKVNVRESEPPAPF